MKKLLVGTVALAGLVGCGGPEPITEADKINVFVGNLDHLQADDPSYTESAPSDPVQDGDFSCSTVNVDETRRFDEIVAFSANTESLYPGAILRGDSVYSGLFTQTAFDRKPLTFSISLSNLAGNYSDTMESPSLSEFRDKLGGILSAEVTGDTPANIFAEIEEVHSEEQLALAMGVDVSTAALDIKSSFNFNDQNKRSRFMVKFVQAFYTVDVDVPTSPSEFFADTVTANELQEKFSDGNPPVYVSSITFGRMVIFSFESEFSQQELGAALNFAFNGGVDVSDNVSLTNKEMLSRSKITAFILGGSGADAVQAINGFDALKTFILEGGNFSSDNPGAPIAYKLLHLADNSPARMSFTSDYSVKDCTRVSQKVKVTLDSMTVQNSNDGDSSLEIYGGISANAKNEISLFSRGSSQAIGISEGQTFFISGGSIGEGILDVSPQAGQSLQLNVHLLEEDTFSDDDYGNIPVNVPFESGWRRQIPVLVSGGGDEILVKISLTPI